MQLENLAPQGFRIAADILAQLTADLGQHHQVDTGGEMFTSPADNHHPHAVGLVDPVKGGDDLFPECGAHGVDLLGAIDLHVRHVADLLDELEAEIMELAKTPYDTSIAYFRRVITARLRGGEASTEAAHFAMLHCGARGFVSQGTAQRRLRESYFIAVVTPATKQLRKMLADLPAA